MPARQVLEEGRRVRGLRPPQQFDRQPRRRLRGIARSPVEERPPHGITRAPSPVKGGRPHGVAPARTPVEGGPLGKIGRARSPVEGGRLRRIARALSPAEWGRLGAMAAVIAGLNAAGWGIFAFAIMPHHFRYPGLGLGLGVAVTAWTLGARHAFDADHISAIDNTTRKLMSDGQRPLGTGFFFALGHSAVIVMVGVGLGFAAKAVFGAVVAPRSGYETVGGVAGTSLAAGFLYLIAALNVVVLAGIVKVFNGLRTGRFDEAELERQLAARGLMWRFFGRFMRAITKTWHMAIVGLIFGVGFDTATEVLLLAATAAAATQGLPWYAVAALPLLFAGGMTLFDTADGCFMNFAYGWAFARPVRKVYYNLVITGLSIAVAFLIGSIEIIGLLSTELHVRGAFWDAMAGFDINRAGFVIAGLFAVVWAAAIAYWKLGRLDQRWALADAAASKKIPPPVT